MKASANSAIPWRKSTYSGDGQGNCVEARLQASSVCIRDSKDPDITFPPISPTAWACFLIALKNGHLTD